jgi:hypothetical protein
MPIEALSWDIYFFLVIFLFGIVKMFSVFSDTETKEVTDTKPVTGTQERIIDLTQGQDNLNFLDRMIKEKFNYHLYLTLMPIYFDGKIPEKKVIKDLKENIYVTVVGSLSNVVKKEMLRFFTEKGIELYVHERIIILLNETDFRSSEKFKEAFRDLNVRNVDKILD